MAFPTALGLGVPSAQAKNGDTHITGQGIVQTIDCNESTLLVNGTETRSTHWAAAGR
jgi:hypothetical protein